TKVKVKKRGVKKSSPTSAVQRRGRTSTSRISSKNQLTVPVDILRKAGLSEGDDVRFMYLEDGSISVVKAANSNEIMQFAGALTGLYDGFDLNEERNSW
ncbi:MAG: AbrB/MazE/SpoVT family DNA-binding domain-containing protein, partial [Actinobacteria bacterium]|nr:AbrB/MazE/SpoVT family DNA-binding domain-containing protein [Actinomycetota bacterium]